MRVLIATAIYPPDVGGPATYCEQMRRGLLERGHEVKVLTGAERPGKGDGVHRIRRRRPFFWLQAMTRFARSKAFDVALVAGMYDAAAMTWRRPWVAKIGGDEAWERARRFGWTRDGIDEFQERSHGGRIALLKERRTRSLRNAARVIAPSGYLAGLAEGWGIPPDRVERIPNGVDPAPGRLDRSPEDPPLLISAGRLVPHKELGDLIDAVPEGARLEIYGVGPERERLVRKAGRRCRILDPLPRSELLARLAHAHALVLNSTYEGLPHLALEAMSVGVPVVATDVGGTSEAVGDGGILVGSHAEFRTALRRICEDDSLRARLSRAAGARSGRFTVERMVERTERVLRDACS